MNNLKLLIKFPTRNRPDKFFRVLDAYYSLMLSNNFKFIVTCDYDDLTMNNDKVRLKFKSYPNLSVFYGNSKSKIEAINANLEGVDFDILLLASDDMMPVVLGYDLYIKHAFKEILRGDLNNVVWFNDGFQGKNLNTLSIIGKKYYDKFNYIYHPIYKSLFCDLEFTQVIQKLNKFVYFKDVIIKHIQYSIIKEEPDELYIRNDKHYDIDLKSYQLRAQQNFGL